MYHIVLVFEDINDNCKITHKIVRIVVGNKKELNNESLFTQIESLSLD